MPRSFDITECVWLTKAPDIELDKKSNKVRRWEEGKQLCHKKLEALHLAWLRGNQMTIRQLHWRKQVNKGESFTNVEQ
jgi:hypothetical protein